MCYDFCFKILCFFSIVFFPHFNISILASTHTHTQKEIKEGEKLKMYEALNALNDESK